MEDNKFITPIMILQTLLNVALLIIVMYIAAMYRQLEEKIDKKQDKVVFLPATFSIKKEESRVQRKRPAKEDLPETIPSPSTSKSPPTPKPVPQRIFPTPDPIITQTWFGGRPIMPDEVCKYRNCPKK